MGDLFTTDRSEAVKQQQQQQQQKQQYFNLSFYHWCK